MVGKTKRGLRRLRRRTLKRNTRKYRNNINRKKRGGVNRFYSTENLDHFRNYINTLSNDNKKQWLSQNIHRIPYEADYDYNFPMTRPPPDFETNPKYYQGIDRIQGYLSGFGGW